MTAATARAASRRHARLADAFREEQAGRAADLLKAMAHPQRLRVLCLLVDGERSVSEINRDVPLSQSALSQHLAKLRDEGLVTTRKDSQTVYYALVAGPALDVIRTLHDAYCPDGTASVRR